jgi:iron complex outermembrane receptor protein
MNQHSARRFWAALSLVLGTGIVPPAGAQIQPASAAGISPDGAGSSASGDDPTVSLPKYIVTGSNLSQAGDPLAVPVTVLSSVDIAAGGDQTDTLDLLRKMLPGISGIGVENASDTTSETYGGSLANLHGLSVLVLVNGQRVASDAAEAVGGDRFTDLNMIPPAAIDRIEVLTDGSSAIYGSDAVGGVMNLILKQDYSGWEATGHYGYSDNNGHYSERSFSLTGGVGDDRTSITVSASYAQSDPIFFSQRPYSNPDYANDNIPGVIDIYSLATGIDEDYILNPKYNAPPGGGRYTMDQLVALGYYIDEGNDADPATEAKIIPQIFNFATGQTLVESAKNANFTANATHKIFGKKLEYFGDFLCAQSKTQSQLNAQPIEPYLSDPYTDAWYNGGPPAPPEQYISVNTPSNPFSQAWVDQGAEGTAGYGVLVHDRFVQFPRIYANGSTAIDLTNGLRGDLNDNYSWELAGTLSRYSLEYANQNLIDAANFFAALASGTINPFAITQAPGVLPGDILGTGTMDAVSTLSDVNFVLRGAPVPLPAGPLSFAAGFSYAREALDASADLKTEENGWINGPSIRPIDKSRVTTALFGEVEIPIFGRGCRAPGAYLLNLDIAGRVEDYYGTVGSSKAPKMSLKYEPLDDQFSLRASAGKSFIAPQLYNLYGPTNSGASNEINYTPHGSSTPLTAVEFEDQSGSNPNLKPSTATTWTAGLAFAPAGLKNFSLTADYFSTHQLGLVNSIDETTIVQSVEDLGSASPYAQYVHFGNPSGPTPTTEAPGQISGRPKSTVWLATPLVNIGGTWTKGFDATADYNFRNSAGKFDLKSTVTVYTEATFEELPTQPYYSYLGDASINEGTVPAWRTYSTVDWSFKGFEATVSHTFVPPVEDVGSGGASASPPVRVASYSQFDATVAYAFRKGNGLIGDILNGATLRLGVNNVFNAYPPLALNAFAETHVDIGTYDGAIGRMAYVDATYKF